MAVGKSNVKSAWKGRSEGNWPAKGLISKAPWGHGSSSQCLWIEGKRDSMIRCSQDVDPHSCSIIPEGSPKVLIRDIGIFTYQGFTRNNKEEDVWIVIRVFSLSYSLKYSPTNPTLVLSFLYSGCVLCLETGMYEYCMQSSKYLGTIHKYLDIMVILQIIIM